jgi:hypothetical protein
MLPNWHRLTRLRRKIGASLMPFSPIELRPPRSRKYRQIVAEIRAIEASLLGHLRRDVNGVLEKRDDKRRERYVRRRATAP